MKLILERRFFQPYHVVDFYRRWCAHFTHDDIYFEYLFRYHGYNGKDTFILQRLGNVEGPPDMDEGALTTFN